MTGLNLHDGVRFAVYSQSPSSPTGSVTEVEPLAADTTAATVLLPKSLPPWATYLIWPRSKEEDGKAFAINRTETWWVGPDKGVAGTISSVYGRNLSRSNGTRTSHIYLQSVGGTGQYVVPIDVNPFKLDFKIPNVPPGDYEVWVHNSHGGRFGWDGPLALQVLPKQPFHEQQETIVNVVSYGAVGNGIADDTVAIRKALDAVKTVAPATLYFPPGKYNLRQPLESPGNITWRGAGIGRTEIRLDLPISASMITSSGDALQFQHLTLNANGNTNGQPLLRLYHQQDVRLEEVRLDSWGAPALQAEQVSYLAVEGSELIENGSFYGSSRQIFMSGNRFKMTGYGESVVALWGGRELSMTRNELSNADESRDDGHGIGRFFVGQAHLGSMEHLYWGGNVSRNAAPHDCDKVDCNKGEQICFEMVGGRIQAGLVKASATTVQFEELEPLGAGASDLVIIGGRGAGQYRRITSVEGATVTLREPWNVVPDPTSRFAIAATASKAVIYANDLQGRESFSEHDSDSTGVLLYGNVYDVVVDSNRISHMRHGMMTVALASTSGLSPYFLQYSRNSVSQSNSGLYVGTTFADSGSPGIWGGLGNIYRRNRFEDLAYIGVQFETWDHHGADFNGTVFEHNVFHGLPYGFIDAYKLMWTYDGQFKAGPGERSRKFNTVLYRNHFENKSAGGEMSIGFQSMHSDNSWVNIGSTWKGFRSGNAGPPAPSPLTTSR
ncbi:polygalacturonase [Pseudorhizobium endolithicum]|uniref:Polygalacturonase n=2 Tax=Pseudorhizobium endolithicum TaxID=1191678 RepID=A0ABN7JUL0_9HYPH|nr:polygalacturonase [Pseudorhizobium endolithicum]